MSWSIEEHIGEGRPWPEQVVVYRGETDECLTYVRRSMSGVSRMAELMDALAAENAKLREQLEYDRQTSRSRLERIDQLKAENAKLRELCEDMLDCIEIRMVYGRPLTSEMYEGFAQRAGELGIEVDG